jgi:hypothetical protein
MAVLNATEIMGQDIIRRCVERVIILGCVVAVPFLRRIIGQGQMIMQWCIEAWAGVFPGQQIYPTHIWFRRFRKRRRGIVGFLGEFI